MKTDRLGPISVNRKAVRQIFREGIYLGVSVGAHLWAFKYWRYLCQPVYQGLYKSSLWAHSMYRDSILNIVFCVLLSLCLSRILYVFLLSSPLNLCFFFYFYLAEPVVICYNFHIFSLTWYQSARVENPLLPTIEIDKRSVMALLFPE